MRSLFRKIWSESHWGNLYDYYNYAYSKTSKKPQNMGQQLMLKRRKEKTVNKKSSE
ncbi:MAG: hypothetical protein HGB31_05160 [Erysipelotrichaceae bacterium]|nr:hypothetical protein [Erysipelotrichaceae bacterium]